MFHSQSPISSQPASPTDEVSVRRFSTFSLLTPEPIEDLKQPEENSTENKKYDEQKNNWYRYSTVINDKKYFIEINHLTRSFTAHDLMGFNNTGNVCVWPSEESLSYYILNNLSMFINTKVLELGAGMSALAGLMVAKYGQPKLVHLTDGNKLAVENIKKSLSKNLFQCDVNCSILQWGKSNIFQKFDVILSADCLFFDEARMDLIDTIHDFLTDRGVALVMAPRRGSTLDIFINCAELKGFRCDKLILYDNNVWKRHLECLQNLDEYDEDIHYPILLKLTKFTRQ